jgi:hypothetical protein
MSQATPDKQRGFGSAIALGMKIANGAFGHFKPPARYWCLDTNAGTGWNRKVDPNTEEVLIDVPGSPLVFHMMADRYLPNMMRCPIFCERDGSALAELRQRLIDLRYEDRSPGGIRSKLFQGDNEVAVQMLAESIRRHERKPEFATGCVIVDPNGCWYRGKDNNGPPVSGLTALSREFPRIDLILNLNIRSHHLNRSYDWGSGIPSFRELFVDVLRKKHWLVKRTQVRGNGYLLAVGRNMTTGAHPSLGMFDINSDAGKEIMRIADQDDRQTEETR